MLPRTPPACIIEGNGRMAETGGRSHGNYRWSTPNNGAAARRGLAVIEMTGMKPSPPSVHPPELSAKQVEARFAWARAAGHPEYLWPEVPVDQWRWAVHCIARTIAAVLDAKPRPERLSATDTGAAASRATGPPALRAPAPPPSHATNGAASHATTGSTSEVTSPTASHAVTRSASRAATLSAPDATAVRALGVAGYTTGTGPLLGYWIETGEIAADPDVRSLLQCHLEHARRRAGRVEAEVQRAASVLAGVGIRATVIKGAHTAYAYFPDPGTRPGSDVDLVVAPEHLYTAGAALTAAGYQYGYASDGPDRHTWWPPDSSRVPCTLEMVHASDPCAIDLHGSFERRLGPRRSVDVIDRARMLQPWQRYGGTVDILMQPGLVAQLALHASQAFRSLTLARLVELVFVVRQDVASGALTTGRLHALLEARGALPFVYPAFEMAERLAPGTVDPDFLGVLRAATPRRVRAMLDRVQPHTLQRLDRVSVEEWFMWARGPIDHTLHVLRWLSAPSVRESRGSLRRLYLRRLHRLVHGRIRLRRR